MKDISAIILSVDEPQLEQCLRSARSQGFSKVVHVNNVAPQAEAYRQALQQIDTEWYLLLGGDMILHNNAMQRAQKAITDPEVCQYQFALWDSFLKIPIYGCPLNQTKAIQSVGIKTKIGNDVDLVSQLKSKGWQRIRFSKEIPIGTHFKNPNEYQVFSRFRVRGYKSIDRPKEYAFYMEILKDQFRRTKDPLYQAAISAFLYGRKIPYPANGHDFLSDRQEYEQWKQLQ